MKSLYLLVLGLAVFYAFISRPRRILSPRPEDSAVVVTGCSSGLGMELAVELAEMGYLVLAGLRRHPSKELSTRKLAIKDSQVRDRIVPIELDVSKRQSVEEAVQVVEEHLANATKPRLLVGIVNNAGINRGTKHILSVKPQDLEAGFQTNVFGVVHMVQLFHRLLIRPGGRIVNIGSLMGLFALPAQTPYAATKWALEGLSDTMRHDLRDDGISVSTIEPGYFASNLCTNKKLCSLGPQDTMDAVVDALRNERPWPRYATATVLGFPGWLAAYGRILPRWLQDVVISNL